MFDLAWSEIALIGIVALVVIGPKDLPEAVRGVARMVRKARTMASEMQGHVDEMVREANLHEVRQQINEIRNFNVRDELEKAVDKDGTIRKTFEDDPLKPDWSKPETPTTPAGTRPLDAGTATDATAAAPEAPAFIPPAASFTPPSASLPPAPAPAPQEPPAFLPPGTTPPTRSA